MGSCGKVCCVVVVVDVVVAAAGVDVVVGCWVDLMMVTVSLDEVVLVRVRLRLFLEFWSDC